MKNQMFKFAKSISLGVSALIFIVILFTLYTFLFDGKEVDKPSFNDTYKSEIDKAFKLADTTKATSESSTKTDDEKSYFTNKIKEVLKTYDINEEQQSSILIATNSISEDDQDDFIKDLSDILKETKGYCESKGITTMSYAYLVNDYIPKYNSYKTESSFRYKMTKTDKLVQLFVLVMSIFLFISFIIVPVIIQIEENTRQKN